MEPNEASLADLVAVLRQQRRIVFFVPLVFLLSAIVYLHLAERKYSVELQVTPTTSSASAVPSGIGNLANLAGLSLLDSQESTAFDLYLEGLRSRQAATAIAADAALLSKLFAEEWDDESGEWLEPSGFVYGTTRLLKWIVGASNGPWEPPDAARVDELLDEEIRIESDRNGSIVTVTIEHRDPQVAHELLSALHQSVDSALRETELQRTNSYIDYLKRQLNNVSVAEYRQALNAVIADQEQRRMVASADLSFAAETFGGPVASRLPTSPRPFLVIMLSLLLGVFCGIVAAFIRNLSETPGHSTT